MVRVSSVGSAILVLFFVFTSSLKAETFKWVDDDGIEHFTDQPLKSKNYEWVEDEEKSYFTYHPAEESLNRKAPGPPSGYASPKTSRQQNKVRSGYGQSIGGGSPAPSVSTEGNYTRQTRTPGTTAPRASTRQTSTARTTGARTTGRQATSPRTQDIRTSSGRTSELRESSTRTSSGRGSSGRTSETRTSSGRY